MATYIKGVTDVIPGSIEMAPDYKMMVYALSTLQNKYDKGFNQIRSIYNSKINAAVSSSDNEEFRQNFLKKADAELARLSSVDLGNANNVYQASKIFDPLVNDAQFTKDLYLTGAQDAEINKMLSVKSSTDEKVRSQYNPIMEDYLMMGKDNLRAMKRNDGSIDKASYHRFSAWQDPIEYASEMAKKDGLEIKYTTKNGLYLEKTVNGQRAVEPFTNWFKNTVGNRFDNQFKIEAYVNNEKLVRGLMAQDPTLDKEGALTRLATDYSKKYIQTYDQQISELESISEEADRTIRIAKQKNPRGVDAKTKAYLESLAERKREAQSMLGNLKTSRGTDEELASKAINLYKSNPSAVLVNDVRNSYAERFGRKQAFGKQEYDIVPDQVALELKRQSFDWAKMLAQQEFDWKKLGAQQEHDITLAKLKKEIPGLDTGAQLGAPTDVGTIPLDQLYQQKGAQLFNNSISPYTNNTLLAVAAGYTVSKAGDVVVDKSEMDLNMVSRGMQKIATKSPMSTVEKQAVINYLGKLGTSKRYTMDSAIDWFEVQAAINQAVNLHKNANPDVALYVTQLLDGATSSRSEYDNMYYKENTHLHSLMVNDPGMRKYINYKILPDKSGEYTINYKALNDLDPEDKAEVLEKLIPDSQLLRGQSAVQMQPVVLNPSKPDEFDYNILSSVFQNASNMGVTKDGEFIQYDEDQIAQFREIVKGSENIKNTFDPNGTKYERKIVDGKDYIKVTMPVKRSVASGKSTSMATQMKFDLSGEIEQTNALEFLVPVDKADRIAGNDVVYKDPLTGQMKTLPNEFRRLIRNLGGKSLIGDQVSWVSNGGLLNENTGMSVLPTTDYGYKIYGGSISRTGADNNTISLRLTTNDQRDIFIDLTSKLGVTYDMLKANPGVHDIKVKEYVDDLIARYDLNNTNAAKDQRAKESLRTDLIPWSQVKL